MTSEDGGAIGRDGEGVPIKKLLLSCEMAKESSQSGKLEYASFMEAFRSVNRDL